MAGRLVMVLMAGQAAPEMQVDLENCILQVEVAVALEDQGRQQFLSQLLVMAVQAFNRPYLVPPIIMAVVVAAAAVPLAMEGWVAVGQAHKMIMVIRVQPSQGAEVVAPEVRILEGQAAPASSSSATRRKPPSRRR